MPYQVAEVKGGFKVKKKQAGSARRATGSQSKTPPVYFSNKPLTKEKANKQMKAIIISELKRKGKM